MRVAGAKVAAPPARTTKVGATPESNFNAIIPTSTDESQQILSLIYSSVGRLRHLVRDYTARSPTNSIHLPHLIHLNTARTCLRAAAELDTYFPVDDARGLSERGQNL